MSINLNQIFVRYPDPKDAAELLLEIQRRKMPAQAFVVTTTGGPWLAVLGGDNTLPQEVAPFLSRALEAQALWFGLAGNTLAYRLIHYDLGREVERILEPAELFTPDGPLVLPAYKDVERELHKKLRALGVPGDYVYLFAEEVGVSGGDPGTPDAAAVRQGSIEAFRHRVPRRGDEQVRTLFDLHKEGDQRVFESLTLHGAWDEERGRGLLKTLEGICGRRELPPGWTVRFLLSCAKTPDTAVNLLKMHAQGRSSFEMGAE
jgi:hypothetical protein